MTLLLGLLAIAALVALSVLISMSEISFAAARDSRLRSRAERGDARAARFLSLRRNSGQVITVLQICLNAVGVLGGIASDGLLAPPLAALLIACGLRPSLAQHLGTAGGFCLVTSLFVLFADLLPKRIAMLSPDRVALAVGWFPSLALRALFPLVWVFSRIADAMLRALRIPVSATADPVTPEDLRAMLAAGTASGVLLEQEHRLIQNVLGLQERWITSAMTPRDDIVFLDIRESLERQREKVRAKPYSRYPLCDGGIDRVIGSIRAEDVLAVMVGEPTAEPSAPGKGIAGPGITASGVGPGGIAGAGLIGPGVAGSGIVGSGMAGPGMAGSGAAAGQGAGVLARMRRDVLSLPETLNLWQALGAFEQHGAGFALIVSEYAVVVGIITFKDIMGALMDGLANPFEEEAIVRRDENSWLVDGIADLGDVARALGLGGGTAALAALGAEAGAYETVGGFVMHRMRRVARKADRIEAGGFTFEVVDVDGFRINQLLVTRRT